MLQIYGYQPANQTILKYKFDPADCFTGL